LCGAATTLVALNACTREALRREPGGHYEVRPEATLDEDAAHEMLTGDEFVFDIQGPLLEYDLNRGEQNAEGATGGRASRSRIAAPTTPATATRSSSSST
jgi:hypothetical protein